MGERRMDDGWMNEWRTAFHRGQDLVFLTAEPDIIVLKTFFSIKFDAISLRLENSSLVRIVYEDGSPNCDTRHLLTTGVAHVVERFSDKHRVFVLQACFFVINLFQYQFVEGKK